MADRLVIQITASIALPEGWSEESDAETAARADDLFDEVCGHPSAYLKDWWVA